MKTQTKKDASETKKDAAETKKDAAETKKDAAQTKKDAAQIKKDAAERHKGHRQRVKDRFLENTQSLADYEILELFLMQLIPRRDTKPLAKDLLRDFGSLHGFFNATDKQLLEYKGIGKTILTSLKLQKEISTRITEHIAFREEYNDAELVIEAAKKRFGTSKKEECWLLLLDNQNKVIAWKQVTEGTIDEITVYVREIFAIAIEYSAAKMILIHNHPSGKAFPSQADVNFTRRILEVSEAMHVELLDHIIVTEKDSYCFSSRHSLFLLAKR